MVSQSLPLLLFLAGLSFASDDGAEGEFVFAAPVRLTAGDAPMGNSQHFPSPALYDLDGDGVDEMVIGDLWGKLLVSHRIPGDDATVWSEAEPLKRADGKPLKFNNW